MPPEFAATIEPATLCDIPALTEMLSELFTLESDFTPDAEKQSRGLTALLQSPTAVVFVARDATRQPIAMITAQLVISTAQGAPSAWIEDVFVTAPHRGTGLGTRLLDAATAWARSRGATRVQLLVDIHNTPALKFYEKTGWQATQLAARQKLLAPNS